MAIFIIDQFSLNTDLPLDIRYVPTTGRFDPDISVYKYPGMQVFDTNTESIWYADNSLNWVEIGSGSDASLNDLWSLVTDLSTYVGGLDLSINQLYTITNQLDASVTDLQVDITRIDASLVVLEGDITRIDASLINLENDIIRIDASLINLEDDITRIDGSLGDIADDITRIDLDVGEVSTRVQTVEGDVVRIDASLVVLEGDITRIDASLINLENDIVRIDGSLGDITDDITRIDLDVGEVSTRVQTLEGDVVRIDASLIDLGNDIIRIDGSLGDINDDITRIDLDVGEVSTRVQTVEGDVVRIDASLIAIEASLGDYVKKSGDTMSGALIIDASFQVNQTAAFLGNVDIGGDLIVDGSTIFAHTTVLDVSTAFINLNTGLTGPPPSWLQSGIIVERGDASSYAIVYDETLQTFRVGIVNGPDASGTFDDSETQAVATREDSPTVDGIAVWNDTEKRFDTFGNLTYDNSTGLSLDVSLNLGAFSPASTSMLVVQPDGYVSIQTIVNYDGSLNQLYSDISEVSTRVETNEGDITRIDLDVGEVSTRVQTLEGDVTRIDASLINLEGDITRIDASLINLESDVTRIDASLINLEGDITRIDASLISIDGDIIRIDASLIDLESDIIRIDASLLTIDSSIDDIYIKLQAQDTSVKGAINVGDGSAAVYAGITADGSLQFREFVGVGAATVTQNGNLIEISIDASFGGEVNTASNIGTGEGVFAQKTGQDLEFKSIDTNDPAQVIITSDNSTLYIDVSIAAISDASLGGLSDTSINDAALVDHTNLEYDACIGKWVETQNIWWDTSLATTTNDLGGIPAGTDLEGQTLKEVLYKILYEYQPPTLSVTTDPVNGTYEKGIPSTSFSSIDINWATTNANYPLALLENVSITKTGAGTIFDVSLGGVASDTSTYTDATGITNWGGTSRTITYNVTVEDDQADQSQPAVGSSRSFTFYYRQYWGIVDGNTNPNQIDSDTILTLDSSRLAGETDLNATFDNSTGGFVKYLFAYPDTVAAPDNFGILSQILDQNDFDITGSWDTDNEDVSVGNSNVRYRFYLAKNKVDTETFDITFKF